MPPTNPQPIDQNRILVSRETADLLKKRFPNASYEDAILFLLKRDPSVGEAANCATTELWIKLDRLEEMLALLALTNVDIADLYRRQVGNELATLRHVSGEVADLAAALATGGKAR
jgi:hypothetical protein